MPIRPDVLDLLREIVGADGVIADSARMIAYECDGFPIARGRGEAVVFPTCTGQTVSTVKLLAKHGIPIVPRGSGTGLTGGCVAFGDGVILCTSRMKRILEVDLPNRCACVEAGVLNKSLTDHVNRLPGGRRLHFSPDPSSLSASTLGGNAATNAGGIHTLKYGVTVNHILGMEQVTAEGEVITTRGSARTDGLGPDLPGLLCGSEGTLGIITKLWVRLTPKPAALRTAVAVFTDPLDACRTVAQIIEAGLIPAAMEMMDGKMVQVVEQTFGFGFPSDAAALLLIELDGVEAALDEQMDRVVDIACANHAQDVQRSADPQRREELWSVRKRAFGAIGRISPSYCTQDACVPRSKLPGVLENVMRIGAEFGLTITNVFHAGDGNVHPILLFDEHDPQQVANTMRASHAILRYCVSVGGTITGEHGVGVEKLDMMPVMFDADTLEAFEAIRRTFDTEERLNPGKLIPSDKLQIDLTQPLQPNTPGGAL